MDKGIFHNAKFGDRFKTRDGHEAIYLSSERHRDRLGHLTDWIYHNVVVNINGIVPREGHPPLITKEVSTYVEYHDFAISSVLKYYTDRGWKGREEDIVSRWDTGDSKHMTKQEAIDKIRALKTVLPAASNEIEGIIETLIK